MQGLVARARWLVISCEQDRLEQAHARLALGPPGDEDQCPLLLAGAAWHPATRCDRRSVTQSVHGFVGGVLWGGLARIFALDHATWAVNSLGHTIGNREFPLRDDSRNIGALAPPTWVGHGTTTIMRGPPWYRPVDTGGSSIWPESSSGFSTGLGSFTTSGRSTPRQRRGEA